MSSPHIVRVSGEWQLADQADARYQNERRRLYCTQAPGGKNGGMTGNASVDIFGRRLGSKVSKAAALAARPGGATMLEIIAATGGDQRHTKYNIFKILEPKDIPPSSLLKNLARAKGR